jgi:two-component system chemotaxis sensor kinase CheA
MRNAIRHGIETPEERVEVGKPQQGSLQLYAFQTSTKLVIELWDDGRGLDLEAIKRTALKKKLCGKEELAAMSIGQIQSLIFAQGFSSRSFIRAHVDRLKGTIHVGSAQGLGCMVQVWLPKTVVTTHVLTVFAARQQFAIPLEYVQTTVMLNSEDLYAVGQGKALTVEGHLIPVMPLSDLLEVELNQLKNFPTKSTPVNGNELLHCVVIAVGDKQLGCLVDKLLTEQEVVYKPHGSILKRVRNVSGSTILSTEEVCIILNPRDLVESARKCLADTN